MSAPLAGGGAERRIFATASKYPPNSASSEAGPEPGLPEPDPNNHGPDVTLGVTGSLRQNAATDPTITVKVMDLGTRPGPQQFTASALMNGGAKITDILRSVSRRVGHTELAVPRFAIKRQNYDQQADDADFVGLTEDFARTIEKTTGFQEPGGGSNWQIPTMTIGGTQYPTCTPSWAAMPPGPDYPSGCLFLCWVQLNTITGNTDVVLYKFDPTVDTSPMLLLMLPTNSFSALTTQVTSPLVAQASDVALLLRGSDLYAVVIAQLYSGGVLQDKSQFFVLQMRGLATATPEIALVGSGPQWGNVFTSGVLAGGGIAAAYDGTEVLVAVGGGSLVIVNGTIIGGRRDIKFARSKDFRTWDEANGNQLLAELRSFAPAAFKPSLPAGFVTDIYFIDGVTGYAVTTAGEILKSTDGGGSWLYVLQPGFNAPPQPDTTGIALWRVRASGTTVYACGNAGSLLKSTDGGTTWVFVSVPTQQPLYALAYTGTNLWIAGAAGVVFYSSTAGASWVTVQNLASAGTYTDMVADTSGNVLLTADQASQNVTGASSPLATVVLMLGATTGPPTSITPFTPNSDAAVTAVRIAALNGGSLTNASTVAYLITTNNFVFQWKGNGTTGTLTQVGTTNLPVGPGPNGALYAVDANTIYAAIGGIFYTSLDGGTSWTKQYGIDASCLWFFSADLGLIGQSRAIQRTARSPQNRIWPALTSLDTKIVLACSNMTTGVVEVYETGPVAMQEPDFVLANQTLTFTAAPDTNLTTNILYPGLTVADNGEVLLTAGSGGLVRRPSDGQWLSRTDPALPIPLGQLVADATYTQPAINSSRSVCAFGGGRIYSAIVRPTFATIGIYIARDWAAAGTHYMPILIGQAQSLGVDGVRGIFAGSPSPGDVWTIAPRYRYRRGHLAVPSPSITTRSRDDQHEATWLWDSQLVVNLPYWDVTSFALFGCTFASAFFGLSNDGVTFTEYANVLPSIAARDGARLSGTCSGPTAAATNVLIDATANWKPGRFAPGMKQWFVQIGTPATLAYRILGNTATALLIDGMPAGITSAHYQIYNDRMCVTAATTGLLTGNSRFARYVRLRVPVQPTPDGFFEAGTPVFGFEPGPDAEGFGISFGWTWTPVTNTTQDTGLTGVKSVEHHGRTGQLWAMQYAAELPNDAMLRKLAPLLQAMRVPFAWVPQGDDPDSAELVRTVDAMKYQSVMARYGSQWALEEVV